MTPEREKVVDFLTPVFPSYLCFLYANPVYELKDNLWLSTMHFVAFPSLVIVPIFAGLLAFMASKLAQNNYRSGFINLTDENSPVNNVWNCIGLVLNQGELILMSFFNFLFGQKFIKSKF